MQVVVGQKTTLRMKVFHIHSFRVLFLDTFKLVALYPLSSVLVGTKIESYTKGVSSLQSDRLN